MKHLKSKLVAMTAMLVVSALMLTSVSYAWYTLSTNPEISGMQATVQANQNLEIALYGNADETAADVDTRSAYGGGTQGSTTGNYYTWGNLIDVSTVLKDADGDSIVKFQPMEANNNKLQYPEYGVDGRVSELKDAASEDAPIDAAYEKGVTYWGSAESITADTFYAFSVDYWVRSNVAGDLALVEAKDRITGEDAPADATDTTGKGSEITGADEALLGALKVAFLVDGATWVPANVNADGTITCAKITTLEANTDDAAKAQHITMFVWLNGDDYTNADSIAGAALGDVTINVQFENKGMTDVTTAHPDLAE